MTAAAARLTAILVAAALTRAGVPQEMPPSRPPITAGTTIAPADVNHDAAAAWIRRWGRPPVDFLAGMYTEYDIVLVGEIHGLHAHAGLVADAIGPLYEKAGVRLLCSEFVRASRTDQLRAILEAPAWDDAAAVELLRDGPWPTWGWREYVDVMQAVWRVNGNRPEGAAPLVMAGLDDDWTQLGLMDADRAASFRLRLRREEVMHEAAHAAIEAHGPKTLIHVGAAHAVRHGIRLAERLHGDYGDRVGSVILHHELRTRTGPSSLQFMIEDLVAATTDAPVGFPVARSPFGRARDAKLPAMTMLGPAAALEDFAPNLVYLGPADTLAKGRWIDGFIAATNFEAARTIAVRMKWVTAEQATTPEALDAALAEKLAGP